MKDLEDCVMAVLPEGVGDFALKIALPISRFTTPLYHMGMGFLKGANGMPLIPEEFGLAEAGAVGTVVHRNLYDLVAPLTPCQREMMSRFEESGPVGDFVGGMVVESGIMAALHALSYVLGCAYRTGG